MMKSLFIGVVLLAAANAGEHWGVPEDDDVAVLNNSNFKNFVTKHKFVFVKFYAPWCGHCKSMAPAYAKLARRMKEDKNGVPIAKVDATVENELGTKYGVKGFPTLKLFINGEPIDYSGAREENPIYDWIMKKTGPSTVKITDSAHFDKLLKDKLNIVYFFPESDTAAKEKFDALAASYDGINFFFSHDDTLKAKLGADTDKYTAAVLRSFDDGHKILADDEALSGDKLKAFVENHRYPNVQEFDQAAAERIFSSEQPAMIFFSENHDSEEAKKFKEFAKKNAKQIIFSISKIKSDMGARLAEFIGITARDDNAVRVLKFSHGNLQKFKCNLEDLDACLGDFKADKLQAYFKSEEAPANNSDPVKVVVGNNFKEIVLDSDKHVLLEAYAPWCGHCKKLAPIYEELGKKLAGHKDVIIAKMDGAANEYPGFDIKGFPTIKFYKRGSKTSPMDFEGDRTLEGFLKFLEKNAGIKLDAEASTHETDL